MADVKISALGAIGSVAGEDLVAIVDDPSGTPASRKATITQIATFINASAVTGSSTTTFTNKTIDAEATGNAISNIDVLNLKSGVLDTDITSVSASDDTIPSAKAVKTYVDAQIATEDTLSELNDTTITSVGDNELLQYNSTSSVWENQTLAEAGISPVAGSSSIVTVGTIATGVWQGTAIASAYIAGDAIDGTKLADDAVDSEHYTDGSIDTAHLSSGLQIDDPTLTFSINAQTGTTYTPVLTDAGKIVTLNNGSAITLTIPPNSSVAYPVGSSLTFINLGAGLTTFAQGSGVTIASSGGTATAPSITAQHNSATCIKIATDTWQVIGAIE